MTISDLNFAIARLIIQRRQLHGDIDAQNRINGLLDNLYDLKYKMLTNGIKRL